MCLFSAAQHHPCGHRGPLTLIHFCPHAGYPPDIDLSHQGVINLDQIRASASRTALDFDIHRSSAHQQPQYTPRWDSLSQLQKPLSQCPIVNVQRSAFKTAEGTCPVCEYQRVHGVGSLERGEKAWGNVYEIRAARGRQDGGRGKEKERDLSPFDVRRYGCGWTKADEEELQEEFKGDRIKTREEMDRARTMPLPLMDRDELEEMYKGKPSFWETDEEKERREKKPRWFS